MPTKIPCLNDGFVKLMNHMGSDKSICNAARISYGNHEEDFLTSACAQIIGLDQEQISSIKFLMNGDVRVSIPTGAANTIIIEKEEWDLFLEETLKKDINLLRYLMRHRHTTPFEMVSFVFLVRCPIHVARQWLRHRTWSYNEYSTRYKEAIDSFETTTPDAWRLQATNNKQGSEGYLEKWPHDPGDFIPYEGEPDVISPGTYLSNKEKTFHKAAKDLYEKRLIFGIAKEQARKDLPLSTYTEFYAKVDLHNLFHFLSLRLDSHAQLEIRTYANAIAELIKPIVPISYKAFEDYNLKGAHFSAQELKLLRNLVTILTHEEKPNSMTKREWAEFLTKLGADQ